MDNLNALKNVDKSAKGMQFLSKQAHLVRK
jgi:hypothetical protein